MTRTLLTIALLVTTTGCSGPGVPSGSGSSDSGSRVEARAARLSSEAERIAEIAARLGSGPEVQELETVSLLWPGDPAAEGEIGRVGGAPPAVGAGGWPTHGGRPMEHLLTLDLDVLPHLRRGPLVEARAVSVFVSDRIENMAFEPGTAETVVVALTADDLAGPPPVSPRPPRERARAVVALTIEVPSAVFEDAAPDDERLVDLWSGLVDAGAYAGGEPLWLQGADHEGTFVLQFDESFLDMNLGDAGVLYAFADTAFWQSH